MATASGKTPSMQPFEGAVDTTAQVRVATRGTRSGSGQETGLARLLQSIRSKAPFIAEVAPATVAA